MFSEYTVKEALAELNVSKATLYYRINKFKGKMAPHILMRNGKKFISREGIEILRTNDSLDNLSDSPDNSLDSLDTSPDNTSGSFYNPESSNEYLEREKQVNNDAFNIVKLENEFLKLQIKEKDNQINTLCRLVENSQLLLKHEQDKNKLLIEPENKKKKWFWGVFTKP